MSKTILLALQDLSPANRQAVIGFYLQGYHYEELAGLLGIPVSTVKWRLFQSRQMLTGRSVFRTKTERWNHLGRLMPELSAVVSHKLYPAGRRHAVDCHTSLQPRV